MYFFLQHKVVSSGMLFLSLVRSLPSSCGILFPLPHGHHIRLQHKKTSHYQIAVVISIDSDRSLHITCICIQRNALGVDMFLAARVMRASTFKDISF